MVTELAELILLLVIGEQRFYLVRAGRENGDIIWRDQTRKNKTLIIQTKRDWN